MRVEYKIIDYDRYNSIYRITRDSYPEEPLPDIDDYTTRGSGEVVEFIRGGFWSKDKFLIVDDKTGDFVKANTEDCKRIKEK